MFLTSPITAAHRDRYRREGYFIAERVIPAEHFRDPEGGDKCGSFGDEPGVPSVVPAGSLVVVSSLVFHRSVGR